MNEIFSKPPYPQIHKCPNGKYRIGKGECKFNSKADAILAFEHWIEEKVRKSVVEELRLILRS